MRNFGEKNSVPLIPVIPNVIQSVVLTANSGQAHDYPAGTDLIRVTAGCTAVPVGSVFFNPSSTGAVLPTTPITPTTATTAHNIPIHPFAGGLLFQVPRGTTGYSAISGTSQSLCIEFWTRASS